MLFEIDCTVILFTLTLQNKIKVFPPTDSEGRLQDIYLQASL